MAAPARCAFVIFGATGDLASRKLLPALHELDRSGRLHPGTAVVGYGRSALGDDEARRALDATVRELGTDVDEAAWRSLLGRVHYVQGAYDDHAGYRRLAGRLEELGHANAVFYTATPPETYRHIAEGLASAGLARSDGAFRRLVVEKPFGHDLASAEALNAVLRSAFEESQVYRIDHYLARETAQNLAVLRFANTVLEPVWSGRYLDHVQITMAESIGIGDRGAFYEGVGVVRDVLQNHMLQLLALVAMEPPSDFGDAEAVRDEKVKVLRALRCIDERRAVLGQYVAGDDARGYREEEGVAPDSTTATFVAAAFEVRTWRWAGVPFYLRTGKRLARKASEIVLVFKVPPFVPFELDRPLEPDRLVLRLVPDEGIAVRINAKRPGSGIDLARVSLDFAYGEQFDAPVPDAYETLLHDALVGDATLFMRSDEVEAQWRAVEPLLRRDDAPQRYAAHTMGPAAAEDLLRSAGRSWFPLGSA